MKKVTLILSLLFVTMLGSSKALCTCESVNFQVTLVDPTVPHTPIRRTPVVPPNVSIEDYTLYFSADHPDYTLIIKDEDGEAVYVTFVTSTETEVTLPATLSGDYQIELVMGNWKFTGWITL